MSCEARVVQRVPDGADLAVHHPAEARARRAPARACARAISAYRLERRVVVDTAPSGVEHAAVAVVGELVQAQVGLHDERAARPRRPRRAMRDVEDAVRVGRPASRRRPAPSGSPNSMTPPSPRRGGLATAFRRSPGCAAGRPASRRSRRGSVRPSLTNSGSTRSAGCERASRRPAGAARGWRAAGADGRDRATVIRVSSAAGARGRAGRWRPPGRGRRRVPRARLLGREPAGGRPEARGLGGGRTGRCAHQGRRGGVASWAQLPGGAARRQQRPRRMVPSASASRTSAAAARPARSGTRRRRPRPSRGRQPVDERRRREVAAAGTARGPARWARGNASTSPRDVDVLARARGRARRRRSRRARGGRRGRWLRPARGRRRAAASGCRRSPARGPPARARRRRW